VIIGFAETSFYEKLRILHNLIQIFVQNECQVVTYKIAVKINEPLIGDKAMKVWFRMKTLLAGVLAAVLFAGFATPQAGAAPKKPVAKALKGKVVANPAKPPMKAKAK
jgi:hypothetical protein